MKKKLYVRRPHTRWPYWVRVLIGIDQLFNAIFGHDPDETISSYLGKQARQYGGTIPWRRPLNALLYRLLERISPGHCDRSIEPDE